MTIPLYGNPSQPQCECSWGIEAAGEALCLQLFEEGLSYAIQSDVRQSIGGVDGTPGGAILNVEPRWQAGYRVMIGYAPNVTFRLVWMSVDADRVDRATSDLSQPGIGLQGTWIPAVDQSVLYSSARFRWIVDFDALDVEVGKQYAVSPSLSFNPICSLRGVRIDQGFQAFYGSSDQVHAMNDFEGLGPRIGVSSIWGFGPQWELFASASASLLYGRFTTHYGFSTPTLPMGLLLNDIDERMKTQVANAEFSFGFGWSRCLSNGRWHVGIRLSYEAHLFWDQNEVRIALGSDAPALAFLQARDLSIQGFGLRAEVEF